MPLAEYAVLKAVVAIHPIQRCALTTISVSRRIILAAEQITAHLNKHVVKEFVVHRGFLVATLMVAVVNPVRLAARVGDAVTPQTPSVLRQAAPPLCQRGLQCVLTVNTTAQREAPVVLTTVFAATRRTQVGLSQNATQWVVTKATRESAAGTGCPHILRRKINVSFLTMHLGLSEKPKV